MVLLLQCYQNYQVGVFISWSIISNAKPVQFRATLCTLKT